MYEFSPYGYDEDLQYLRLRNLLSPTSPDLAVQSVNESGELQEDEMIPRFSSELMSQYRDLVARRPQRPEKPGRLKRIQAGIATLATDDPRLKEVARENVLYGNYNRELRDWADQLENFKELAGMEGSRNINERVALSNAFRERRSMRDLQRKETETDAKIRQADERLEIAKKRAETYELVGKARAWKMQHPNYKFETGKDGKVYGINQADPSDVVDTGIESRFLDDMDKADLQLRNRLSAIRATGEEQRKLEGVRQGGRIELENEKYPDGRPKPGTSPTARPEAGSSIKARQYAKAREAYNTHPEWQPYIELMTGNDFKLIQPKRGLFGRAAGDPKVYQQVSEYIYGTSTPDKDSVSNETTITKPTETKPAVKPTTTAQPANLRERAIEEMKKMPKKPKMTEANILFMMEVLRRKDKEGVK